MLNSTIKILSQYLDTVSRFNVYSIEMSRNEQTGEFYYLCNVNRSWFIVYEADDIDSLSGIAEQAVTAFGVRKLTPAHWLPTRGSSIRKHLQDLSVARCAELATSGSPLLKALTLHVNRPARLYVVLEVHLVGRS